jgi:hypothetical protein
MHIVCSRIVIVAIYCASVGSVQGDELTRRLQEELRRRHQFFGDIDGKPSDELSKALQSYQKRKSLVESGVLDLTTAQSIGLPLEGGRPAQLATSLPDTPVLKSDEAREITEKDQEFLRNLEEISESVPPVPEPESVAHGPVAIDTAAVEQFIRDYLMAAEAADPAKELGYYAARVDYFDHGLVPRSFIEKDVRNYYKRWTNRKFEVVELQVRSTSPTEATVVFRIRFDLKGKRDRATGQTDNTFKVRQINESFQLTSMRERRVRT